MYLRDADAAGATVECQKPTVDLAVLSFAHLVPRVAASNLFMTTAKFWKEKLEPFLRGLDEQVREYSLASVVRPINWYTNIHNGVKCRTSRAHSNCASWGQSYNAGTRNTWQTLQPLTRTTHAKINGNRRCVRRSS